MLLGCRRVINLRLATRVARGRGSGVTRPLGLIVSCAGGNRRPMIRTRRERLPFKMRQRRKYQDLPRELDLSPNDAEFNGRMSSEIGGSNGPRHLSSLVQKYGPSLLPSHLALALSKLAGFASKHRGGGGLSTEDSNLISTTARRSSSVLLLKSDQIQPMQAAMVAYSLARLGIRNSALTTALVCEMHDVLGSLTPQGLSCLLYGLSSLDHFPPGEWLDRFCMESYIRMHKFEAADVANTLHAFAKMRGVYQPSEVWIHSAQKALKRSFGTSCNGTSLVRATVALAKLLGPPHPPPSPSLSAQPSPPPSFSRPSLNFMTSLTAEAKLFIDSLNARELTALFWSILELAHAPDVTFYQLWTRAVARRMASLDPSSLPLVLDAMQRYGAMTRGLPPTATLAQLLLSKLESLYPLLGADEIVHCLYCLVKMRVRPNEEWMRSFDETMSMSIPGGNVRAMSLEWQEKPEAASLSGDGGDVIDRVSRPISGGGLGKLTWCYGRLRYQPSEITRDALVSRVQDLLKSQSEMIRRGDGSSNSYIGLTDLGLLLWSVRRSRMLLPSATYEAWKGACIGMLRSEAKLEGSGREVLDLYLKGIEEGEELDGLHDHLSPPTPLPSSPPSPSPTRYPPAGVPERRQPATARSVLQASVARLHSPNDYFKGN